MAANVLNSPIAIQPDLKRRLAEIERRVAKGFAEHEQELREIRFLISELQKPEPPKKTRLGF